MRADAQTDPSDVTGIAVKCRRNRRQIRRNLYAPLHPRFPSRGHERVGRIARDIVDLFDGDARKIWKSRSPLVVLKLLLCMRVGTKISWMIVGALHDAGQIDGAGDLAPDIHIRRVLGRVFTGNVHSTRLTGFRVV